MPYSGSRARNPHLTAPATLTPLYRGEGAEGLEPRDASNYKAAP